MQKHLIAAIDVGSHAMRMKIGEISKDGEFRELEVFRKVISLGHDTFTKGKLGYETVDKICDILEQFKKNMNDYNITIYQATATSAIREASNKDYIIDQIKLKTDIDLRIISNAQEQYLTHKAIKKSLDNYSEIIKAGVVMVVIGAGSVQVTTYEGGQLTSAQNLKMGALRIKELLSTIENTSNKYIEILGEFIDLNLGALDFFVKDKNYEYFIAVGGEVSTIQEIISTEDHHLDLDIVISKGRFNKLYKQLIDMSMLELQHKYQINSGRASIIVPSMMMFKKFLEKAKTKTMMIPNISLVDGLIQDTYEHIYNLGCKEEIYKDMMDNAEIIARKFDVDMAHSKKVDQMACQIFDLTRRIHGLDIKDRLLLRIAALLHDVGKYISVSNHNVHSYYLVKSSELIGLSEVEMELIAIVTKYHSGGLPTTYDSVYAELSDKNRVFVSKLIAILRLADALDRSHLKKLEILDVQIMEKEVVIECITRKNFLIESWSFKDSGVFFKEVFGLTPVLKVKKEL